MLRTHEFDWPHTAYLVSGRDHKSFQFIFEGKKKEKRKIPAFRQDVGEESESDALHMHVWLPASPVPPHSPLVFIVLSALAFINL